MFSTPAIDQIRSVSRIVACVTLLSGCVAGGTPQPGDATRAYADAASRGDADALYEMLSVDGKKVLTLSEVRTLVSSQKAELSELGRGLSAPGVRVKTEAKLEYADGEHAALVLEDGEFRVSATDALPAESRTPVQALDQLRRVIARRSYAGLIRLLSPRSRAAIEDDLRSLVLGLEAPEGLEVEITGEAAVVHVPGGHLVRLRREEGVWHVEDFN